MTKSTAKSTKPLKKPSRKARAAEASVPTTVEQNSVAPMTLSEDDYEAIAAAVMETARGRWFLDEYARRNRHAESEKILTALEAMQERWDQTASVQPGQTDTTSKLINRDLLDLAEAITQVKKEVRELGGQGEDDHFNSATIELESIVSQTEAATSEILEAAEKVQEVIWTLREDGADETQCSIIESKVMEIYTACSFQDLTGQRSSKVVRLVSYVERRVASMMAILGLGDQSAATTDSSFEANPVSSEEAAREGDSRPDAKLMNGPASLDDQRDQGAVDALFDKAAAPTGVADAAQVDVVGTKPEDQPADVLAASDSDDASRTAIAGSPVAQAPLDDPAFAGADVFAKPDVSVDLDKDADRPTQTAEGHETKAHDPAPIVEIDEVEIVDQPVNPALLKVGSASGDGEALYEVESVDFGGKPLLADAIPTAATPSLSSGIGAFDINEGIADIFVTDTDTVEPTNPPEALPATPQADFNVTDATADIGELVSTELEQARQGDYGRDLVETESDVEVRETDDAPLEDNAEQLPAGEVAAEDGMSAEPTVDYGDDLDVAVAPADTPPIQNDPAVSASEDEIIAALSDAEEVAFDHALEALESDIGMALAAQSDVDAPNEPEPEPEDKPQPRNKGLLGDYTDAERIALFS